MLSSAVSSRMLAALAAAEGLHWEETLTGFKWLGNRAKQLEGEGSGNSEEGGKMGEKTVGEGAEFCTLFNLPGCVGEGAQCLCLLPRRRWGRERHSAPSLICLGEGKAGSWDSAHCRVGVSRLHKLLAQPLDWSPCRCFLPLRRPSASCWARCTATKTVSRLRQCSPKWRRISTQRGRRCDAG